MLNTTRYEPRRYRDILDSINETRGSWIPKWNSTADLKAYQNAIQDITKGESVNTIIVNNPSALANLVSFLSSNKYNARFIQSLNMMIGLSIQDRVELEHFTEGLALNAYFASPNREKNSIETVRNTYSVHPELIMVRLMELVTVTK